MPCVPMSRKPVSKAGEPFSLRPSPAAIIISIPPVHGPMNITNEQEITDAQVSEPSDTTTYTERAEFSLYIYIDDATCAHYYPSRTPQNAGGICSRANGGDGGPDMR
ncbi:unnamed protein product [Brugia pahangi]|uniref:Uncharacterized protein n=1 Tax=Brugia pahangi TaxID=6280 RepID=A0A0N4TPB5_BRUPA|nr:unnamed protein product [Brugia pahangi]